MPSFGSTESIHPASRLCMNTFWQDVFHTFSIRFLLNFSQIFIELFSLRFIHNFIRYFNSNLVWYLFNIHFRKFKQNNCIWTFFAFWLFQFGKEIPLVCRTMPVRLSVYIFSKMDPLHFIIQMLSNLALMFLW